MSEANPTGKLILVVDDESIVVRAVTATLAMAGYRVMVAENGIAGLETFMGAPEQIDLVLTDLVMPSMNGIEMAERILTARPNVPVVLMSGYDESALFKRDSQTSRLLVLRKP